MNETIENMISARRHNAKRLVEARRISHMLPVSERARFLSAVRERLFEVLPLRESAFRRYAANMRRFAASELPGVNGSGSYVGSDGYSYCGLADAHFEEREGARQIAEEFEEAANELARRK